MLKYLKWQELICGALLVAAGIILIVRPELTLEIITKAIGCVAIIAGLMFVLGFIIRRTPNLDSNSLVTGCIAIAAGAYIFFKSEDFIKIVPMMMGIGVIISGLFKIQRALELAKMHFRSWVWVIIFALVNIMGGLIIVLNPAMIAGIIMQVIGAGLIYSGALDIITTFFIAHRFSAFLAEKADKEVIGSAREEDHPSDDHKYEYNSSDDHAFDMPDESGNVNGISAPWEETDL